MLRSELRSKYQPGSRLPSESDLASRFDVSIVTIREATQRLCQEGFLERRHGSGTYVLETRPPTTVALLVSQAILGGQATFFFHHLFRRLQEVLNTHDIATRSYLGQFDHASSDAARLLKQEIEAGRIDAVITICANLTTEWATLLEKHAVPVIGEGEHASHTVGNDCEAMVRQAVRKLVQSGRRHVAFMQREPPTDAAMREGMFLPAFMDEMSKASLPFRREWVFGSLSPAKAGSDWERFRSLWQAGSDRPDGLLIVDDYLYMDAAPAIMALGIRVPDELLVLTHANKGSEICYPFPTLRLEFDPEAHVQTMLEMLQHFLAGQEVSVPKVRIPFTWCGDGA